MPAQNSALPLASICIPNFNMARYLPDAIESALAQDYGNIEIVIQENRSSDTSLEVIRRYAARQGRIRVFENERHVSMSANWNRCVRHARGDYFVLLSADDLLERSFVSACVAVLEKHRKAHCCCSERVDIDDSGAIVQRHQYYEDSAIIPGLAELKIELMANFATPSQTFVRRSAWNDVEGYDERFDWANDIHLRLKLLLLGDAAYLSDPLCRYRIQADMSAGRMVATKLGIMEIHRVRMDILDRLPPPAAALRGTLPAILRNNAQICLVHAAAALRGKHAQLAREYGHLALAFDLTVADTPAYRDLQSWLDGAPMPPLADKLTLPSPFELPEGAMRLSPPLREVA